MDKLKTNIMKLKDQATEYIKENPDQVESMKDQAIGALKQTVDKEAVKESTDDSKFNKAKADAINLLKPQLDKLAAEKEEAEAAAAAAAAAAEEDDDEVDNGNNDFEETNPTETKSTTTKKEKSSKNVRTDTKTTGSNIDNNVQDLVTEMLSMMDDANLSKEEQKKAVNAFNVAMSFKLI
jgi:hypothetical protein